MPTEPAPNVDSSPDRATVALVQMSCVESKQANVDKALGRIAEAAAAGANIVCLQELFAGRYPCQTEDHRRFDEAEPIPGPTSELLRPRPPSTAWQSLARFSSAGRAGSITTRPSLFDADGSLAGMYRKMHIPDDPLYYEKFYFTPGDLGFRSLPTRFWPIGACVCWDQWYPEAARLTALAGAKIIFYPTAIGWLADEKAEFGASQHSAWETMMRSHAIANGVFVAAPNRVGVEGGNRILGRVVRLRSQRQRAGPRQSHDAEETLLVECNLARIDVVRTHWPFLRDRRIDAYGDLTQRYLD